VVIPGGEVEGVGFQLGGGICNQAFLWAEGTPPKGLQSPGAAGRLTAKRLLADPE